MIKIKNKYEHIDVIELEDMADIVDRLIVHAIAVDGDNTVALIANKELVMYAMGEVLSYDCFNVRAIDVEISDIEYMISIDTYGGVIVQPITDSYDEHFKETKIVYVSMEGDVAKNVIDECVNDDKYVILFYSA